MWLSRLWTKNMKIWMGFCFRTPSMIRTIRSEISRDSTVLYNLIQIWYARANNSRDFCWTTRMSTWTTSRTSNSNFPQWTPPAYNSRRTRWWCQSVTTNKAAYRNLSKANNTNPWKQRKHTKNSWHNSSTNCKRSSCKSRNWAVWCTALRLNSGKRKRLSSSWRRGSIS